MRSLVGWACAALLLSGCGSSGTPAAIDAVADGGPSTELLEETSAVEVVHTGDNQTDAVEWKSGCVGDLCAVGPDSAPDPAEFGPFPVGVRTFTTTLKDYKGFTRSIVVDIYYPATEEARNGPFEDIDLLALAPDDVKEFMPADKLSPVAVPHVRDAPIRKADGPYPLVVFSHGAFGVRFQSIFFTHHLASHGFVVVSAGHSGNTLWDMLKAGEYSLDPVVDSAWNRPLDVTHLIDTMIQWNDIPNGTYSDLIDPERIAMAGHSFGGYTSILQGFDDERIKVVVPMCPATQHLVALGYELEEFPLPAMIMAGAMDNTLEPDKDMRAAYDAFHAPKYYMEFAAGGHYTFTDICSLELEPLAAEKGFVDFEDALEDGCADYNIPTEEAHPIIRRFAIGFLNYYLRESPDSKQYFSAEEGATHEDILLYLLEE